MSTSKAESYCPLPGLQSVCIPTWQVPVPFSSGASFPFSAAPFVLLVAMHYLIPKASFVGHLSGIVIGYPLTWGLLDWCGLELLARVLVLAMFARELLFGTDRRVVSIGSPAVGGSFDSTNVTQADIPTVIHDGGRSKLLLTIACAYIAVTALSFATSSWCVCCLIHNRSRWLCVYVCM